MLKIAKDGIRPRAILGRIDQCSHREADQLRPTLRLPWLLPFCRWSGRGVQRNLLPALRRSPPRILSGVRASHVELEAHRTVVLGPVGPILLNLDVKDEVGAPADERF